MSDEPLPTLNMFDTNAKLPDGKMIGPDHGGDTVLLTAVIELSLWDRLKFLTMLALGSTIRMHTGVVTEKIPGRTAAMEIEIHHVFDWWPRRKYEGGMESPPEQYDDRERQTVHEIRQIDDRNKKRSWRRRWFNL